MFLYSAQLLIYLFLVLQKIMPFLCIIISLLLHAVQTTIEKTKKEKKEKVYHSF